MGHQLRRAKAKTGGDGPAQEKRHKAAAALGGFGFGLGGVILRGRGGVDGLIVFPAGQIIRVGHGRVLLGPHLLEAVPR